MEVLKDGAPVHFPCLVSSFCSLQSHQEAPYLLSDLPQRQKVWQLLSCIIFEEMQKEVSITLPIQGLGIGSWWQNLSFIADIKTIKCPPVASSDSTMSQLWPSWNKWLKKFRKCWRYQLSISSLLKSVFPSTFLFSWSLCFIFIDFSPPFFQSSLLDPYCHLINQ